MARTFHRVRFTWLAYLSLAFYAYFPNVLTSLLSFTEENKALHPSR
jgi:hypothetical protein